MQVDTERRVRYRIVQIVRHREGRWWRWCHDPFLLFLPTTGPRLCRWRKGKREGGCPKTTTTAATIKQIIFR
jgi:hypothetical protein